MHLKEIKIRTFLIIYNISNIIPSSSPPDTIDHNEPTEYNFPNRVSVLGEILHGVNFFDFVLAIGY